MGSAWPKRIDFGPADAHSKMPGSTDRTENGAKLGDLFMSLIHTTELSGVNPFDYLTSPSCCSTQPS